MRAWVVLPLILLAACGTPPGTMPIGITPQPFVDLREARSTVEILERAPAGAKAVGPLVAERCFQSFRQGEPTEDLLKDDLLIQAMRAGANAITNVAYSKRGPGMLNCWHILTGKAIGWRSKEP